MQTKQDSVEVIDQRSIETDMTMTTESLHASLTLTPTTSHLACSHSHSLAASPARSDTDALLSMAYDEWQSDIDIMSGGHKGHSPRSELTHSQTINSVCMPELSDESLTDNSRSNCAVNQIHASTPIKTSVNVSNVTPVKISPIKKCAFTSPKDKHFNSIQNTLDKSLSEPLNKTDNTLLTKFAKRKIRDNVRKKLNPNVLTLKTGGKLLFTFRATASQKDPMSCGQRWQREQIKTLNQFRDLAHCKLENELSIITKKRREEVLRKTKGGRRVRMDRKRALALKESLGLSTRKARLLHESLRDLGVTVEGEKKQIKLANDIVRGFVSVQEKVFRNETLSETPTVPFAKITDLPKFLDQHLDNLSEKGLLTWRDGLDEDTILVKIGADHGKNSLKFTMGVVNTPAPNSQYNTIVIGMAAVKDTYENLAEFLKGGISVNSENRTFSCGILDDLKTLQGHVWKGKKIKLCLNGDYDFLCKAYGISGATGKFPCIWCHVASDDLNSIDIECTERTVKGILEDHERFLKETKNDKSEVKFYNNALHPPLIPIELNDVCPPHLHIVLGLVWRHHVLLKKEIYELEIMLINQGKRSCTEEGLALKELGNSFRQKNILEEQLRVIETFISCTESNDVKCMYENLHDKTENELADLAFKKLEANKGPISASTDAVLTKHNITPQSYHGGAFTGNHCHKYVAQQIYRHLTKNIFERAQKYTYDTDITDKAHEVRTKFDDINEAFYKIHKAISHTNKIHENSIEQIQTDIDTYISKYLKYFGGRLIPKQHILHKHCLPYIKRHGFGLGLTGEQSTESSHQVIARIEKRAVSILNGVDRLGFVMNTHILLTSPMLFNEKEKRKRKRKAKM